MKSAPFDIARAYTRTHYFRLNLSITALLLSCTQCFAEWSRDFAQPGPPGGAALIEDFADGVLVGGSFTWAETEPTAGIARWTGTEWKSVGGGLTSTGAVYAFAKHRGEIYVGGSFTSIGGMAITNVARWDGTNWSAVGEGIQGYAIRALLSTNDMLYAAGQFVEASGKELNNVAVWNGFAWEPMGLGLSSVSPNRPALVSTIAAIGNDVFFGGVFERSGALFTTNLARWNGSNWIAFPQHPSIPPAVPVTAMTTEPSGGLFVGTGLNMRPSTNGMLFRWDGGAWEPFGPVGAGNGFITSLYHDGEKLYVSGLINRAGSLATFSNFVLWDGNTWQNASPIVQAPRAVLQTSTKLFTLGPVVGPMLRVGHGLSEFDGQRWRRVGAGIHADSIHSIASNEKEILLAGRLPHGGDIIHFGKWDGMEWSRMGSGVAGGDVHETGDKIVANGSRAFAIHINGRTSQFDGRNWSRMADAPPYASALNTRGDELILGYLNGVRIWNGEVWREIGDGLTGRVYTINLLETNIVIGGDFTTSQGVRNLAMLVDDHWVGLGADPINPISAAAVHNRSLYVGGQTWNPDGSVGLHLARWDGGSWNSYQFTPKLHNESGAVIFNQINAITFDAAGTLYVGGLFHLIDSPRVSHLARFNDKTWSALGEGLDGAVQDMVLKQDRLYVVGGFSTAGGYPSARFAEWKIPGPYLNARIAAPERATNGVPFTYNLILNSPVSSTNDVQEVKLRVPPGLILLSAGSGKANADTVSWQLSRGETTDTQTFAVQVMPVKAGFAVLDDYAVIDSAGRSFTGPAASTRLISTNAPPRITVTRPGPTQLFTNLSDVSVSLDIVGGNDGKPRVDIFLDHTLINSLFEPPYDFLLPRLDAGDFSYTVTATDRSGMTGSARVEFSVAPPSNDDFAARAKLVGAPVSVLGSNAAATAERGEANHARSLWWSWRAPRTGTVVLNTVGTEFRHNLSIATGTNLTELRLVTGAEGQARVGMELRFQVEAEKDYEIVVSNTDWQGAGLVEFSIQYVQVLSLSVLKREDSVISLRAEATTPSNVLVETSTNLIDWLAGATNSVVESNLNFSLPFDPAAPRGFYRGRIVE